MAVESPRPGVRLTDAEREHAAARLHVAQGEGRISLDELDQRLAVVYAAQVAGDLDPALHDLPTDRERALLAGDGDTATEVDHLGLGDFVRRGRWLVARRIVADNVGVGHPAVVGPIVLDLREAVVPHPQVDVELRTATIAQIVLPDGATADLSGVGGFGPLRRTPVPAEPAAGQVHVVVRGVLPRRWMLWVDYRPPPWWWRLAAS